MNTIQLVGLAALVLVMYHFVGYPILLAILAPRENWVPVRKDDGECPSVTLIIAAFNEEKVIGEKLRNALGLDYPPESFRIVVVADGSSDTTADVVRAVSDSRVTCLFDPVRRGKSHALNRAVAASDTDVLVLSDANNFYSSDAIRLLVARLREAGVGGATGAKSIVESRERMASAGDGLYWKYESRLKSDESALGGTVTADGEIFALWRKLYVPIPPNIVNDDLYLSIRIVDQGYRIAYEPRAKAVEEASFSILEDYRTKVRMIAGGFQNLRHDWRTIFSHPLYALKFTSHKILRWTMPVFLLIVLMASLMSSHHPLFKLLLVGQLTFYALALIGWLMSRSGRYSLVTYVPFYFVAMNFAAAAGMVRFLRGGQSALWIKAAR